MKLDRSQFLKEVKEVFPELQELLNAEEGLATFEVDVFCDFTQKNINNDKREIVKKCFDIADRYMRNSNHKFSNTIMIGFLEGLEFKNTKKNQREWAWECFPDQMKNEYISFFGRKGI